MLIRPTVPEDTPLLLRLADETRMFKPMEIQALQEVLDDYHGGEIHNGHFTITAEIDGQAAGFAYYAPAYMTEGSWYLYWIAVSQTIQGRGIGAQLLRHVEEHIRSLGGRMLFIETSSMAHYEPTRQFYLKKGYEVTGVLREFYTDGDDMVVFRKRMNG
jgi:GNAT superfamily N-acetyltransferase